MKLTKTVLASTLFGVRLLSTPLPAAAEDWQFTKWGMTVDEVQAASGEKAVACTTKDCQNARGYARTKLTMPMKIDGFDLLVGFDFDRKTQKLAEVHMTPKDKLDYDRWLRSLRIQFRKAYGPEKEEHFIRLTTWKWKWGDGEIWMTAHNEDNPDIAELSYISKDGIAAMNAE